MGMKSFVSLLVLLASFAHVSNGFSAPFDISRSNGIRLNAKLGDTKEEAVKLGSEAYYKGFVSRSIGEEPEERVTGDAVLGPTFKFVGGFAVGLVALVFGFMASNGLL